MEMIGSDISDIHIPSRLSDSVGHKRAIYTIAKILKFYSIDPEPSSKEEKEVIREYRDNIATILESQKKMYQSYRNQLYDKCSDSDVEIVDCTTMKMTSQRFIQKVIGKSVHGHYLVTLGNNGDGLEYDTLLEWPYNVMGWERIDIPEFLLCSPEMPIIGWDDGPVFDTGPECEKERAENYQKMSDAELGYVRRIREYYGETMPYLDYMTVSKWVLLITAKGTRYRDLLSNIKWASSADHSDWAPIVPWDDIGKSALRLISKVVGRINHK